MSIGKQSYTQKQSYILLVCLEASIKTINVFAFDILPIHTAVTEKSKQSGAIRVRSMVYNNNEALFASHSSWSRKRADFNHFTAPG
jgi:hypothetical protein